MILGPQGSGRHILKYLIIYLSFFSIKKLVFTKV
jgi:hypothetical protein